MPTEIINCIKYIYHTYTNTNTFAKNDIYIWLFIYFVKNKLVVISKNMYPYRFIHEK